MQAQGHERLRGRPRGDTRDVPVAPVLAAHHVGGRDGPDRIEHLVLPVPDRVAGMPRWRFHGEEAHHLEQMVLDDIADRARPVVERAPVGDVERLGHVHLDTRDVVAVPERLLERVGEPEVEQVLDRLLAQVVVDPEDPGLGEDLVNGCVQGDRAPEIAPERLLEDDPRAGGAARGRQVRHHLAEERRRDRQVVEGMPRVSQLAPQRVEGLDVVVRALDVAQPGDDRVHRRAVDDACGSQALAGSLAERVQVARACHADDRQVEALVAHEPGQGREDLFEGQVARGPEEDEGVGPRSGHRLDPRLRLEPPVDGRASNSRAGPLG